MQCPFWDFAQHQEFRFDDRRVTEREPLPPVPVREPYIPLPLVYEVEETIEDEDFYGKPIEPVAVPLPEPIPVPPIVPPGGAPPPPKVPVREPARVPVGVKVETAALRVREAAGAKTAYELWAEVTADAVRRERVTVAVAVHEAMAMVPDRFLLPAALAGHWSVHTGVMTAAMAEEATAMAIQAARSPPADPYSKFIEPYTAPVAVPVPQKLSFWEYVDRFIDGPFLPFVPVRRGPQGVRRAFPGQESFFNNVTKQVERVVVDAVQRVPMIP